MICATCNEDVAVCICPDRDQRLHEIAYGDALIMFKWCRTCDRHYARCRCATPDFYVISQGKEVPVPAGGFRNAGAGPPAHLSGESGPTGENALKAELRVSEHAIVPGANVIEIWFGGRMIGTVTGADGPGVRILSKYPIIVVEIPNERATPVHVVEVRVFE